MIQAFRRWWRSYLRSWDVALLWPECVKQSQSRSQAETAFHVHMILDSLYDDMSAAEKIRFIKRLPDIDGKFARKEKTNGRG